MSKKNAKIAAAPKPELTWQDHRKYTIQMWTQLRGYAEAELKKFAEKLTGGNPQYAMEWGGDAFCQAAKHAVNSILLTLVSDETVKTADDFLKAARRYADDAIRDGLQQQSTSVASNEAKKRLGEEWLRVVYERFPHNGFERMIRQMYPEANPVIAGL